MQPSNLTPAQQAIVKQCERGAPLENQMPSNPITLFRGWRARRWCEKWARGGCGNDSLRLGCEEIFPGLHLDRHNAYADRLSYCPASLKRVANGVGPTEAHAWLALRKELEAHDAR